MLRRKNICISEKQKVYRKVYTFFVLAMLILNIFVLYNPISSAKYAFRTDGEYLYQTLEDGITVNFSKARYYEYSLDKNNTIEGKYCMNITSIGVCTDNFIHSNFSIPIRPQTFSIKINIRKQTTNIGVGIFNTSSTQLMHIYFSQSNQTILASGVENRYFTSLAPYQYNSTYTVTLFNIRYTKATSSSAGMYDITISNETHSQTYYNCNFKSTSENIGKIISIKGLRLAFITVPATRNTVFIDDWTCGIMPNITSLPATNITSKKATINSELINDGSPFQNATQHDEKIKLYYDDRSSPYEIYTYLFNKTNSTRFYANRIVDGSETTYAISLPSSSINTTIDTLSYVNQNNYIDCIYVGNNIYAATAPVGLGYTGYVYTMEIYFNNNTIRAIQSSIFDAVVGADADIFHVNGDRFAIVYRGPDNDGWIKTINISATNGTIYHCTTPISSYEFDTSNCFCPRITNVSGDIYAIAYSGPDNDGWLKTIKIGSNNGTIYGGVVSSHEFDTSYCYYPKIIPVGNEYYAIIYNGPGTSTGTLKLISIQSFDGSILGTTDTQTIATSYGSYGDILHLKNSSNLYAITYFSSGNDLWIYEIFNNNGTIRNVATDSYSITNPGSGYSAEIFKIQTNKFGIISSSSIITLEIDENSGKIGKQINSYTGLGTFRFFACPKVQNNRIFLGHQDSIGTNVGVDFCLLETAVNITFRLIDNTLNKSINPKKNITKVYLRAKTKLSSDCYQGKVSLRPIFNGTTEGQIYNIFSNSTNYLWSDWIDITNDTQAIHPSNWNWTYIKRLDCLILPNLSYGEIDICQVEIGVVVNLTTEYKNMIEISNLYTANTTNTQNILYNLVGLNPGTLYFYRPYINTSYYEQHVHLNNTINKPYSYGDEETFLTRPSETSSTYFYSYANHINTTWTNGTGNSNRSMLLLKSNGFPTSSNDGTVLYNSTKPYNETHIVSGTKYHFATYPYSTWLHLGLNYSHLAQNITKQVRGEGWILKGGGYYVDNILYTTSKNLSFSHIIINNTNITLNSSQFNIESINNVVVEMEHLRVAINDYYQMKFNVTTNSTIVNFNIGGFKANSIFKLNIDNEFYQYLNSSSSGIITFSYNDFSRHSFAIYGLNFTFYVRYENHSYGFVNLSRYGPHKFIVQYEDKREENIFQNGVIIQNETNFSSYDFNNGTFNISVNNVPLWVEFNWNDSSKNNVYISEKFDGYNSKLQNLTTTYIQLQYVPISYSTINVTCINRTSGVKSYPVFGWTGNIITIYPYTADGFTTVFVNYSYSYNTAYRCNRIQVIDYFSGNITFWIFIDKKVYGETTSYFNDSLVRYNYDFEDKTSIFINQPNIDTYVYIYTYTPNNTRMIIHSEYWDSTDKIYPWLLYDKKYFIGIKCTSLNIDLLGVAPTSSNLNPVIIIAIPDTKYYSLNDIIIIKTGWMAPPNGCYVNYQDTVGKTKHVEFRLYNFSNNSLAHQDFSNLITFNFTYPTACQRFAYYWTLTFNHSYWQNNQTVSGIIYPFVNSTVNASWLDQIFNLTFGKTPVRNLQTGQEIPWIYIGIFVVFFVLLVSFAIINAIGAVAISGIWLAFAGVFFHHLPEIGLLGSLSLITCGIFLLIIAVLAGLGGYGKR